MKTNIIYNENCLNTLKNLKDKSIDLTLTSPPYNMNLRIRNGKYCSRQITKEFSTKYEGFNDNLPIDEYYELHLNILKELIRVSNIVFYNIQVVTGSKRAFFKIIGELSDYLKEIIFWDKVNAQPAMQKNVLNSQTEIILVFGDNPISRMFTNANFKRGELSNTWQIKRGKKINKNHGAVFPLELAEKIIKNFSSGGVVYDPFAGTGTTLLAAKNLNLEFIGSELLQSYHKDILTRLNIKK